MHVGMPLETKRYVNSDGTITHAVIWIGEAGRRNYIRMGWDPAYCPPDFSR